jgi:hypothetical protein
MATKEELVEIQSGITSVAKPVFTMLGVANPVAAAAVFGVETLFRFLALGAEIRAAIEEQRKQLDTRIRTEGILRVPITVDTRLDDVLTFFVDDPDFPRLHPEMDRQFAAEIAAVQRPGTPEFPQALRMLDAARRIVPRIERTLRFEDDPLMDELFGKWLDPAKPDFRAMIQDYLTLANHRELGLDDHVARVSEFTRMKLSVAGATLDADTASALAEVNTKIRALVRATLFGDKGFIKDAVRFTVNERVMIIDGQVQDLNARKAEIQATDTSQLSEAAKEELKEELKTIDSRVKKLADFKTRLSSSL